METRALARGLLALGALAEAEAGPDISGVSGLLGILAGGRLDFLKSLRESFQLSDTGWEELRLVLANADADLSLVKEVLVVVVVVLVLFSFDLDLALAIISPQSSSEPSFWSPVSLKLAEEDANRIFFLSTFSVGFFNVADDFILLTNLGLSMEGLGNFFTDLRALMVPRRERQRDEDEKRRLLLLMSSKTQDRTSS